MALTEYVIIAILIAIAYGVRRVLMLEKKIGGLEKRIAEVLNVKKKK
jgi:hypothetical protein